MGRDERPAITPSTPQLADANVDRVLSHQLLPSRMTAVEIDIATHTVGFLPTRANRLLRTPDSNRLAVSSVTSHINMSSCGTRRILRTGLVVAAGGFVALGSAATASATTDPDGLVDAARAGFDAYLDEVDPPDPGSDPDELDECPLLAPARPTR